MGPDAVFEKLVEIATTAERAGFSAVTVMDHYHQIPPVGPPQNWMFEGNTILAGLAARTESIALGMLVGGVTYRNPAQHAKITTGIDVISGGRAFHGIGAAWFEGEHDAYGYGFPPLRERFERLEDHLRIARAMFTEEQATVAGAHHSVTGAYNNPAAARRHPDSDRRQRGAEDAADGRPVRRRLQLLRRCRASTAPHRRTRGPLRERRPRSRRDHEDVDDDDRDRRTDEGAQAKIDAMRAAGVPQSRIEATIAGTPERVLERAQALRDVGIEGVTFSMGDVHDPEAIMLAGETLTPVFNAERQPAV